MQSNGKKRNASRSTAQNKICQMDRAVVPVSNANKKCAETIVNQEKMRAQQVNQRTYGKQNNRASFHSESKKTANSERANDGPWMQNDKAELGKKDRAVVPVSGTNYFSSSFFSLICGKPVVKYVLLDHKLIFSNGCWTKAQQGQSRW